MGNESRQKKKMLLIVLTGIVTATSVAFAAIYCMRVWRASEMPMSLLEEENFEGEEPVQDGEEEGEETSEAESLVTDEAGEQRTEKLTEKSSPDWESLWETNKDIYAWLWIPDLEIDYPILQSKKDDYYLRRNLQKEYATAGCIYTNACNAKDFTDLNTVIYGHNMKNKTMFGRLSEIGDLAHAEECQIYIYTPEKCLTYSVCAAVQFSDVYIPDTYGVKSKKGQKRFLKDVQESKNFYQRNGVELSEEDQILTLSTCVTGQDTKRYLVIAKLEKEEVIQ